MTGYGPVAFLWAWFGAPAIIMFGAILCAVGCLGLILLRRRSGSQAKKKPGIYLNGWAIVLLIGLIILIIGLIVTRELGNIIKQTGNSTRWL